MLPLLINLNLLSVGIAVAGIGAMGLVVFLSNPKSATNKTFLLFSLFTIIWGISNYLDYQFTSPNITLWALRFDLFISIWHAFWFFQLAYVFPNEKAGFSKLYKFALVPLVALIAVLTLTPFVFTGISHIAPAGQVTNPDRGLGIIAFAVTAIILVGGGIASFFKKMFRASGIEKAQYQFVVTGTIVTFLMILVFDLVLPVFFNQLGFLPLGAVFLFPFIMFTAYAIVKHHLLSVKVVSTEILAFVLVVTTFSEVILSQSVAETLFRVGEFILVSIISMFLIKSVLREVEQREELERLNKQIEDANKKLEDLSHFKSELLSLASHQIRSPLAAMKGFLSLILGGSYGPVDDKAKEALRKVGRSADELIDLINTLLDVRKVEEGKMEYQFAKTDLNKIMVDVTELLRPLAEGKGLEFAFTAPAKEVWVSADAQKLQQVIQNLVDNAIKYTPAGFVRVSLEERGGAATVTVADSGLGFSPTLAPYLFEEFIRDERVKKEVRGTGLGLYIARKITEAHGGKLWAESAGEGKGSAFHLSIPILKEVK